MNIHVTSGSAEPLQPKAPEQRFTALLPCPFCGGTAQFGKCEPGDVEAENDGAEYIECEACGASTCLVFPCMDAAKPRLCDLWNNRAKAEPVAYLHTVRVVSPHANPNEIDQALSFSPKSFPLGATGMFESIGVRPLVFGDGKA